MKPDTDHGSTNARMPGRRGTTEGDRREYRTRKQKLIGSGRGPRRGDDIALRLRQLATGVLRVTADLPENANGKHISRQLLRSGTSPGANYEEARGAESRADFIHKVAIALKEVRESQYWLLVVRDAGLSSSPQLQESIDQADEIIAILTASRKTATTRER